MVENARSLDVILIRNNIREDIYKFQPPFVMNSIDDSNVEKGAREGEIKTEGVKQPDKVYNTLATRLEKVKVFSGSSNTDLSRRIVEKLGISLGEVLTFKYSNGETGVEIQENVREMNVFIIESGSERVNDSLMEMLLMIQACKIASVARITAIIPFYPYVHQDEKYKGRASTSAKLIANMLRAAGADCIITMDLHPFHIEDFLNIPVENLSFEPLVLRWIKENISEWQNAVTVSTNLVGAMRVTSIAQKLGIQFALIHHKFHDQSNLDSMELLGNVRDKVAILIDDLANTCKTICDAANMLMKAGAIKVYAILTHGIFSENAISTINDSALEAVVVTNTISQEPHATQNSKIQCIDVSSMFVDAIVTHSSAKH